MTTTTTNTTGRVGFLANLTANLSDKFARRRTFSRSCNELYSLTDRELSDIGLHRSMIRQIAHEGAYGTRM